MVYYFYIVKILFILVFISNFLKIIGCSSSVRYTSTTNESELPKPKEETENISETKILSVQEGIASYYGPGFHGKKTASGEIFDKDKLTAAHRTLPFGTIINVTNLKNGKKIKVKINDRGPFVGGRILDLSQRAASELDMLKEGTARVRIEVLILGDNKYKK